MTGSSVSAPSGVVQSTTTSPGNSCPASEASAARSRDEPPANATGPSASRSTAHARSTARPPSIVARDAVVSPVSSSCDVSTTTRIRSAAIPSSSAASWRNTVWQPCPISVQEWNSVRVPSASGRSTARPRSTSPLPMPVFLAPHAIPAYRASRYASRTASSVALIPTPGPSRWPVPNRSPTSSALRHRISQRSMPACSASMSSTPSSANAAWLTPNPRIAPDGGLLVYTALASTSTLGTRYGPQAWPAARSRTLPPTLAYAPLSPTMRARTATRCPSASQPAV